MKKNIFLFHRDLRLVDNTALLTAPHPITPLFVFPDEQIDSKKNKYFSHAAVQFMCESLEDLNSSITKLTNNKSRLHMCRASSTVDALVKIHTHTPIASVTQNKDFSLYALERDALIEKWCAAQTPPIIFNNECEDYDLVKAKDLLLLDGRPYTVLSAYYNRFIKECVSVVPNVKTNKLPPKAFDQTSHTFPNEITVKDIHTFYEPIDKEAVSQKGGRSQALLTMKKLTAEFCKAYDHDRNYPAIQGTTMLSAHLKFGTISVRELFHKIKQESGKQDPDHPLVRELVFRSFYIKICTARPKLQRGESFRQDIDSKIQWLYKNKNEPEYSRLWKAWTEGKTGFPLVDAGMRQLNATGHMHGRVRMVAATVLTRYFLIDWRDGARYFAQHLVDYDPCSNNMGWQFSSALGENSQNVYRAPMNPFLQSKNFDKDAEYIKRWIPELATPNTTPKQIHSGTWDPESTHYPRPVVDQKEASRRAVTMWKAAIKEQ